MFSVDPIGYFHSISSARYDVPRQPSSKTCNAGIIQLKKNCQFEQALEGLEGFDRLWVLFLFHQHTHWKPKVLPPRGGKKQGVFATRSPHRPNFIGMSCVELKEIQGLKIFITCHDLLDGTPIIDLKPYLNYSDAVISKRQGWLEQLPPDLNLTIEWEPLAYEQINFLQFKGEDQLKVKIEQRLYQSPLPYPNNRVKKIAENFYELSYRTWRIYYHYQEEKINIHSLLSGYDKETLQGSKLSKWDDVAIHQAYCQRFN